MNSSGFDAHEIRTFLVLADELHFGRTAERLTLTRSRVSQIIRRLEARIGGTLFDRTSRRVRLSPLGQQLLREVQPAYRQIERALQNARETAAGVSGTVRLGMYTPANGGPHLVEIVTAFRGRFPSCDVVVVDIGLERDQVDWLRNGEIDVLAMRLPVSAPDIEIGPTLSLEERVLAVAASHPLAGRAHIVWDEVADFPVSDVATISRELTNALVPPSTSSGRPLLRVDNANVGQILTRVALGELVHPTVASFGEHHRHPDVVFVPIRDLPPSETVLAWHSDSAAPILSAFIETAYDVLRTSTSTER